jgi:hypothetical protein
MRLGRSGIATAAAVALTSVFIADLEAATVAYWRFPAAAPNPNYGITFPLAADAKANTGVAQITTNATVWNGQLTGTNEEQGAFQFFTGSTINALSGDAAGQGLSMRGLTSLSSNGKSLTFQFDSTGFADLQLSYAERTTSTGPTAISVSTSTNGVDFTSLGSTLSTAGDGAFALRTIDLTAVDSIENSATAYIRLTFTGFSGNGSGSIRFDNIVVSSIPEPASLAALAIGALAGLRRRR